MNEKVETPPAKFCHLGQRGRRVTFEQAGFNNRIVRNLFRYGTLSEAVLLNRLAMKPDEMPVLQERLVQLEEWQMLEFIPAAYSGSRQVALLPNGKTFGMDLICNRQLQGKTPDGPDSE